MTKRHASWRTKITKMLASPLCQDRLATFATLLAGLVLILAGTLLATTSWLVLWIAIFTVEALLLASTLLFIRSKGPTRLRQVRLAILAVVVLLSADLLTLQITRELLDSESRRSTIAVALLAIAAAAAIPLLHTIWQRLPEIDDNLRTISLSFGRVISFVVFMPLAGLTGFFTWEQLRQDGADSTLTITLLISTFVAVLFALWGQDLVSRLTKFGPGGIEFGMGPQEIAPTLNIQGHFDKDRSNSAYVDSREGEFFEEIAPSAEESWNYERTLSNYLYLEHSGVDILELEGADLRSYRNLILWVGKETLRRHQFQKAVDILRPVDQLRDVTYDELLGLGVAHWYLAIDSVDSGSTTVGNAQSSTPHYREARRLLERAIKSPNREAQAHWALAYVYDELGVYGQAIEQNLLAIGMDPKRFHTWGYWSMAVSYLKNGEPARAIEALEQIESDDDDWQKIWEDEELEDLRNNPQDGPAFAKLCGKSP